jgi:CheY-like chemotaxis protein
VTEVLESCDYRAVGAEHPDQIADDLGPFDLVLADLVEQRGRAFEADSVRIFVKNLQTRFRAPVVIFTAYSPSIIGDPASLGAVGVIGKPFDVDEFAHQVTSFLRRSPLRS